MSENQTLSRVGALMAGVRRSILEASGFEAGLSDALAQVCRFMSADRVSLITADIERQKLIVVAEGQTAKLPGISGRSYDVDLQLPGFRLMIEGGPSRVNDLHGNLSKLLADSQCQTIIACPILSGNEISALLCLHKTAEADDFASDFTMLGQIIAEELLLLISKSNWQGPKVEGSMMNDPENMISALTRQLNDERLMRHIISKLHLSRDRDVILQTAVDCLGRALNATFCLAVRIDISQALVTHEYGEATASPLGLGRTEHLPPGIVGLFKQKTTALNCASDKAVMAELSKHDLEYINENEIRALLGTPIVYHGLNHGVILILDCRNDRVFTEREILLLETIAEQVAVAVNHAELLSQIKDQLYKMNVITTLTQQLTSALEMVGQGMRPQTFEEGKNTSQARLSQREMEVLRLIAQGLANREIAQRLFLTESTVELHASRIRKKLKLKSRTALVKYACDNHLV